MSLNIRMHLSIQHISEIYLTPNKFNTVSMIALQKLLTYNRMEKYFLNISKITLFV